MKQIGIFCLIVIAFVLLFAQQKEFDYLAAKVAAISGMPFRQKVELEKLSLKQLNTFIQDYFRQEYPQEEAERGSMMLYLFGFTRQKVDLRSLRSDLLLENVAGIYDDRSKKMLIRENLSENPMLFNFIISHELRHALQDQYFSLNKLFGKISDYDDRKLAKLALVEGDATLLMMEAMGINPEFLVKNLDEQTLELISSQMGLEQLKNAPRIISSQMIMPYVQGLKFVLYFYRQDRWQGVNRIYQNPPQSSYQIYFPQEYEKGSGEGKIFDFKAPQGLNQYHSGVIGYHYWTEFFTEQKLQPPASWVADSYVIYNNQQDWLLCAGITLKDFQDVQLFLENWDKLLKDNYQAESKTEGSGKDYFVQGWNWRLQKIGQNSVLLLRSTQKKYIKKFLEVNSYGN